MLVLMKKEESLFSIFMMFLRFGLLAWGGPVAQIAMLKDELVDKQHWIMPEKFRRALAVYQALPGPEAHELCVYFGMIRAGRWGGFLAGLGFMLPGLCFMLLLSWAYVSFGASALLPLFIGIAPAVTALIVRAAHRIGSHVLTGTSLWVAAATSILLTLLSVHFLFVFVICATWQSLWAANRKHLAVGVLIATSFLALAVTTLLPLSSVPSISGGGGLLVEGLKAGLLSFGGAYTSIPFLQNSMVGTYSGITQQTFLDGIAIGNVIPAPLIIFGTYLGYIADGLTGAFLMTLGIFLPAFAFTLVGHNYLERMIENRALHGALDGVSASVVGLLTITALDIFRHVITGWQQAVLFIAALIALYFIKKRWGIPFVILVCGLLGLILPLS
jgi:chromate transporter